MNFHNRKTLTYDDTCFQMVKATVEAFTYEPNTEQVFLVFSACGPEFHLKRANPSLQ